MTLKRHTRTLPYKNKELGRILKREKERLRMMKPGVRETKNAAQRRRDAERKERINSSFGGRPSARQLDNERAWMSRASKILSGENVDGPQSQDQKNRHDRRNVTRRAYRARPEVRDRIRRYDRIRKLQPERKLQRRLAYRKRKHAMDV